MHLSFAEPVTTLPCGDEWRDTTKFYFDIDTDAGLFAGKRGLARLALEYGPDVATETDGGFRFDAWRWGACLVTPWFMCSLTFGADAA